MDMDQKFLILIHFVWWKWIGNFWSLFVEPWIWIRNFWSFLVCVMETDRKFLILTYLLHVEPWTWIRSFWSLFVTCGVTDKDQKFLILIHFVWWKWIGVGICEAMDQKFLVPIFAVRGAMDQIFLIHSCLWNHELGTFDHLYLFVEPRGWGPRSLYNIFFENCFIVWSVCAN